MEIIRMDKNPIITQNMSDTLGESINGPSLIKVPEWLENPLGKYYLYFANHQGKHIRLAYADYLKGPWEIYEPGTLQLKQTQFPYHIASPDIHIDDERQEIRMYYHGCCMQPPEHVNSNQMTCLAFSDDGINFNSRDEILGSSYWRVFRWNGYYYSIEMFGQVRRSREGITDFEKGPVLFENENHRFENRRIRHLAVKILNNTLYIFFTKVGDAPEHIKVSTVSLENDWLKWEISKPISVLKPDKDYEGAHKPIEHSESGVKRGLVHQLRDPAIYEENGETYLLYAAGGEHSIVLSKILSF